MSHLWEKLGEIALSSFLAWLCIPLGSEVSWHSWRAFGAPDLAWATAVAFVASSAAMMVNYVLGRLLSSDLEILPLKMKDFDKAQRDTNRYFIWILLVPWIPFLPLFSIAFGFVRVHPLRFLAVVALGRAVYYGYYLFYASH